MKRTFLLPILIWTVFQSANLMAHDTVNIFAAPPGTENSSYSMHPLAGLVNPVFSEEEISPILAYAYTGAEGTENLNHFFSLNIFGLNLIYGKYSYLFNYTSGSFMEERGDLYHINKAFLLKNTIGAGAGFTYIRTDDGEIKQKLYNVGFLYRPVKYLSLGYSLRDIYIGGTGPETGYYENYSVSLRPFRWLTLTGALDKFSESKYSDSDYSMTLELNTPPGITVRGSAGNNGYYTLSAEIPLDLSWNGGTFVPGYIHSSSDRNIKKQHGAYFAVTSERRDSTLSRAINKRDIVLKIDGQIKENTASSLFSGRSMNFQEVLSAILSMSDDNSVGSIFLEIDNAEAGMAQIEEMRAAMAKFRRSGKKIYAQMNSAGNREYYIACAADKIYIAPGTGFSISGLSAQLYFIRELLDKTGIRFESVRYGKYKSFNETFTRKTMSPELRENLESILTDLNSRFTKQICTDRKIPMKTIEEAFNSGFLTPQSAQKLGFIDGIGYFDELKKKFSPDNSIEKFSEYRKSGGIEGIWGPVPVISVVHVDGTILRGKGDAGADNTTDSSFISALERAFRNSGAVVIRVDSGGGSAAASDFMLRSIKIMKEKYGKPVVFSFGNTAASGGYYISCTGDKIFTNPGTITGSIGVIAGKISLQGLYKKLGINKESVKLSPYADIFTESRDLTPEEKTVLQKSVDFTYRRFISIAMEGRKIKKENIDSLAQGRVFTGDQSIKNGLTDSNGGILAAIEFARIKAGIDENFAVVHSPAKHSFPSMTGLFGLNAGKGGLEILKKIKQTGDTVRASERGGYIVPYFIEIK